MTREEAIEVLDNYILDFRQPAMFEMMAALKLAIHDMLPVSREQVEKVWRGKWKCHGDCGVTECSICGWNIEEYVGNYNFCPVCGAAQTDKAVEMVMERLEALHEDNSCS